MKYEPALDGLRAVAILSVMGFHAAPNLITGGSLGVDVFFVLSGWLITSILWREAEATHRIDYRAFLLRRARRLLPALFVFLAIYALVAPLIWPAMAERRWLDVGTAVFYVTNLREAVWPAYTPLSHTWSLAIEEQFYVLWPLALMALRPLGGRRAGALLLAAWLALTLGRGAFFLAYPTNPIGYYATPFHATGLLLGSALALAPVRTLPGRVAFVALGGLMIAGRTAETFPLTIAAAELLTVAVITSPPSFLAWDPLRRLGVISYGVYLWHVPIMALLVPRSPWLIAPAFAVAIVAGWLSHVLIERRFLKRRGLEHPRMVGVGGRA